MFKISFLSHSGLQVQWEGLQTAGRVKERAHCLPWRHSLGCQASLIAYCSEATFNFQIWSLDKSYAFPVVCCCFVFETPFVVFLFLSLSFFCHLSSHLLGMANSVPKESRDAAEGTFWKRDLAANLIFVSAIPGQDRLRGWSAVRRQTTEKRKRMKKKEMKIQEVRRRKRGTNASLMLEFYLCIWKV